MPINIFKYDGTLLTTVADGTIDTTHSTLKFPGTGYQNYGPPIMENILWTMQNFAGTTQPTLPLTGQTWFDTTSNLLKVYTGSTWQAAGGVLVSSATPSNPANIGAFWYDNVNMQMYVWNGAAWDIIGPLGSAVNTDPINNTSIPTFSKFDTVRITDSTSAQHQVWRIIIGGVLFAIISKDATFTPAPAITGFATIQPGINFNTAVAGVGISGDTTTFRSNQNNLPDTDGTRSLGSTSFRFNSVNGLSGIFSNSLLVNTSSSSYNFQVTGSSYLNGPALFAAGTASAAPVRLQTGSLLTTPAVGALEFDGSNIYITLDVGGVPTRSVIAAGTSGGSTSAIPNTLALRDSSADIYANVFQGIASSARYADLAERYETDMPLEPGDVVMIGGAKEITKTTEENSNDVFGVISTNPAYRMNEHAGDDTTHPFVAIAGRVPCKVTGTVKKGERLVTSNIPGVAIAASNAEPGHIAQTFARALVDKTTDHVAIIEVALVSGGVR
jgi:hypothetical protein